MIKALDKLETGPEILEFLINLGLNFENRSKLSNKYTETQELREKTREAFNGRLKEIPKEKREAYVRYE